MKINYNRSGCPVSTTLDLVGDRWSLIIIRDIFLGRTTFSHFLSAPEKIATNILRDRLSKLMNFEIINFRIDPNNKKIKQYYLTDKGIDLYPILYEMSSWSIKHLEFDIHPLAQQWLEDNEGKSASDIIQETISHYIVQRKEILNLK